MTRGARQGSQGLPTMERPHRKEHQMNIMDNLAELAAIVVDSASVPQPRNPQAAMILDLITIQRASAVAIRQMAGQSGLVEGLPPGRHL